MPSDAVVDDARLEFMGVPAKAMDQARAAVASLMQRFAISEDLRRFPLAFQITTGILK